MDKETIKDKVRRIRNKLEMTQEEFGHEVGATVSSVNRWEKGLSKPHKHFRKRLEEIDKENLGN